MEEIILKYGDYLIKEKRYSLKTFRAYTDDVFAFFKFIFKDGEVDLNEVDYSLIRSWIVYLSENKYSSLSINRKISSLKSFFKFSCHNFISFIIKVNIFNTIVM